MKISFLMAACALAGSAYCTLPSAQDNLRSALEAAWQRSVESRSAAGDLGRARAAQAAAEALWAAPPALELSHRGEPLSNVAGQRESEIGLAWPLLLPGQRDARGAAAHAELQAAEAAELAGKLRLATEVREAAWTVLARRAELRVAQTQARSLQALVEDVARRVASGDLARTDLLAAQAEHAAANALAADAQQRLESASGRWRLLTGLEPPQTLIGEEAAVPSIHPQLRQAELATEAAQRRFDLVRATRREAPEVTVRYRHEVAASHLASERSVGFGVRIPFGTADRNQPREAAALAELDVAQARTRRLREQLDMDISIARSALAAAESQLAAEESRAALLNERAQLLQKAFDAGEAPLAELLRTVAAAAQAEAGTARQRAELGLARARLQQALGVLP